jgi:hypothetical protein
MASRTTRSKQPRDLAAEIDKLSAAVVRKTEQQILQEKILDSLAELGHQRVTEDAIAREGTRLVIPATMTPGDAVSYLNEYIEQQETETSFPRTFQYRPNDGAAALQRALVRVFGSAGIGKATWTFFGKQPPQLRTIKIGVDETLQVPQGELKVPSFDGTMHVGESRSKAYGPLFAINVVCARKYKAHVEGLFQVIEEELQLHSIYKGKAVDGNQEPDFLDLRGVDPRQVVYATETVRQLEANIWSVVRHTETLREMRIPRKRAILLEGPYGTGKTLAAYLTAQICEQNGWTFLYCRPGKDDITSVMGMARLYQPSVVFFEDVDVISSTGESDAITRLLDLFDGIQAKGTEIMAVLTTNHKERIHKAMVRPGRMDAMVHIGALDRHGIETLVRVTVPEGILADDLDFDRVYEAMEGFLPAFAKEAIDRTMRYAISRDGGVPSTLTTQDFVDAAVGLRPQLELMASANEGEKPDPLAVAMRKEVHAVVQGAELLDPEDNLVGTVSATTTMNGSN